MKRTLTCSVLLIAFGLASGGAIAKTPDGQTPAEETICSGLSGAAFGLCNAYCEAQDCDVHPRPSCERLRRNFAKITGSELFPCDGFCGDGVKQPGEECEPPGDLCPSCVCPDPCPDPCVCFCHAVPEVCSDGCTCEPLRCEDSAAAMCGGACPDGEDCIPDSTIGCSCIPPPPPPCEARSACGGTCPLSDTQRGQCQPVPGTDICECLPPPPPPCGVTATGECGGTCDAGLECRRSGSAVDDCACLPPPPTCDQRDECGGDCVTVNNEPGQCSQVTPTACVCQPDQCLEEGAPGCFGFVEERCCVCDGPNGPACLDLSPDVCSTQPGCKLEAGFCGVDGACVVPPPPEPCCPGLQCVPPGVCLPVNCTDRAQCGGPCGRDLSGNCAPSSAGGCGCNIISGGG